MKFIVNVLCFLLGITWTNAQNTYKLSGTVTDSHDKTSLQNAKIEIGNFTVMTTEKGSFVINNIPKGSYVLSVSHPDCAPFKEDLMVTKNLEIDIRLEHHVQDIETITLHGTHKNSGSMVVKTLNQVEIERNSTENLGNLLTKISGVSTLKTGNNISKPIIHGLYGSRITIINNGVKMAEQEWGVEHAPNVDINNFAHIDVIKGASTLKYGGDATGGVVVLEPEVFKAKDTLRGSANLSGISNGRGIGLDLSLIKTWKDGWGIKSGGSVKKLGDQKTPDYNLVNTGMDFSSFNFTVQNNTFAKGISFDYYLTNQNIGIYRGSHVGNSKDFYNAINSQIPFYTGSFSYDIDNPKQAIEHHIAKISAFKRFDNFGKVSATYSFQYNHRQEYDIRRGELKQIPSLDLALMTHQFNINDVLEREKFSLESGVDAAFQNNYSDPATKARRLIPNYDQYSAGIYSVFKYKLLSKVNVEAGLRYDYRFYDVTKWYDKSDWEKLYSAQYPEFYRRTNANRILTRPQLDFQNLSFNAGVEFHPSGNFNLKFNYAKASRTPNIAELFSDGLHHSASVIEIGDLGLQNETSHQFNLIADTKVNILKGLQISVNPYYSINKNFINQIPTGIQNTIRGVFPVWSYKQIDATLFGADIDIDFQLTNHFSYTAKGSYVYGEDESNKEPLILMMPPNFSNAFQFNNSKSRNFYVNVENQTFLKQTRFPIHNSAVTFFENGEEVVKTVDFSTPPKGYSLWNLQAGIDVAKNFSAGLTINNAFDVAYRDYLNRMRYFATETGRNFILNFRYKF
ncbi:TonB-dependent receptor [Chryseobacterium sp. MP_3.2]|uniref:TonB-dependent receptor n=1 Tax=Chryseobacterium sp. MP_3.2 TaxID=3071712 RepID=UPI002E04107B|nr:iron complex outermembrane receptor protein [Chryseobacterium sp. MP_3.2]